MCCSQRFAEQGQLVDFAVEVANFLMAVFYGRSPIADFCLAESELEAVSGDGRLADAFAIDEVRDLRGLAVVDRGQMCPTTEMLDV